MSETDVSTQVESTTPSDYIALSSFDELPLSPETRASIVAKGYTRPTPVQAAALKPILARRDVIVRSKTGTGKTAAFGIPVVELVDPSLHAVQAIVLCNTRELALQVAQEITELGQVKGVKVAAIYGGSSMDAQLRALREGATVVVGTPGRVIDLIDRRTLVLDKAKIAVLDEADEMLGVGFLEDVMKILSKLPKGHQTLLFSATLSPDIEKLIRTHLNDPETILLSGDVYTVEGINHVRYFAQDSYPKPRNLLYMLQLENPETAIIFCNTRDDVNLVTTVLNRNGFDADKLSGELAQSERERVMAKVKRGDVRFMVATDIAARGIDISDLTHVINYSLPEDPSIYLHRVGRTGRIGKTGTALSLVRGTELVTLTTLEKKFGIKFEEKHLPTPEAAHKTWADTHIAELRGALGSHLFDAFVPLAHELKQREGGEILIAFALKYFFHHHRLEKLAGPRQDDELRHKEDQKKEIKDRLKERRTERTKPKLEPAPASAATEETSAAAEPAAAPAPRPRAEKPTTRLYVGIGLETGLDADGIKAAFVELTGVPAEAVQIIETRPNSSRIEVTPETLDTALGANGKLFRDQPVKVEGVYPAPSRRREEGSAAPGPRNRLFVRLGTAGGLDAAAIQATLLELTGASAETIRKLEPRPEHTYVDVTPESVETYLAASGKTFQEKAVTIEVAKPPTTTRRRR
jgi:ATP-dependent RNA helicase DeaD